MVYAIHLTKANDFYAVGPVAQKIVHRDFPAEYSRRGREDDEKTTCSGMRTMCTKDQCDGRSWAQVKISPSNKQTTGVSKKFVIDESLVVARPDLILSGCYVDRTNGIKSLGMDSIQYTAYFMMMGMCIQPC